MGRVRWWRASPQLYHIVQDMAMVAQTLCLGSILWMILLWMRLRQGSSSKCCCCSNDRSSSCDEPWGIEGVIGHEVSHIRIRYSHLYDCGCPFRAITMLSALVAGWCGGAVAVAGTMIEKVAVVWRLLFRSFPCLPCFSTTSSDLGPVSHFSSTGVPSRRFSWIDGTMDDQCFVKRQ